MAKIIYGGDTETCEGVPFLFQFFSADRGHARRDLVWINDPSSATERLLYWCGSLRSDAQHVVYVHNLGFDTISFLWGHKKNLVADSSGEFDFRVGKWRIKGAYGAPTFFRVSSGKHRSVVFVDSFSWFRATLAKAADLFCPHLPKLDAPADLGTKVFHASNKAFCSYAMRDAEIAYYMGVSIEQIHQDFDITQTVSIADTAARVFRHHFVHDPIPLPDVNVLTASLASYHGGKNNWIGEPGWYRDVTCLDISSAYPHAMAEFPSFTVAEAYRSVRITGSRTRSVPDLGVYCVRGELAPCKWPIFYSHSFKPLPPGVVIDVWVTGFELNEALSSGEFRLANARGYIYDADKDRSKYRPMAAYVEEFYRRKQTETDKVKRTFDKLLLNALYGKFIQTRKRNVRDAVAEDNQLIETAELVAGGLFHPFIATLITGHTRARIHAIEHKYQAIHTATDGIITTKKVNLKEQNGIGSLVVEACGDVVILRNKLYVLYGPSGEMPSSVFRGKKIIKYAMHGFQGTIYDLERLIASGFRYYSKNRPNTLRESLNRGLVPNKFEKRAYTLKVGSLEVRR